MPWEACGRIIQLFYERLHKQDFQGFPTEILRLYNSLLFYGGEVGPDNL